MEGVLEIVQNRQSKTSGLGSERSAENNFGNQGAGEITTKYIVGVK